MCPCEAGSLWCPVRTATIFISGGSSLITSPSVRPKWSWLRNAISSISMPPAPDVSILGLRIMNAKYRNRIGPATPKG